MATEETNSATVTIPTDKKEIEQDIVSSIKETKVEDNSPGADSNPGVPEDEQVETHVVDTKETVEPETKPPVVVESVEDGKHESLELPVASELKDDGKNEPVEPKEVDQIKESCEVVEKDVKEIDGDFDKIEQSVVEDVSGEPQITASKFVDASEEAFEVKEEQVETVEENPVEEKSAEASEKAEKVSEQSETVSADAKEPASETEFDPERKSESAGLVDGANDSETETKTEPDVRTVTVKEVLVENVENPVTDVKSSEPEAVPVKETEEVVLRNQEPVPEMETKEAEKETAAEEPKQTITNNDVAEEKIIVEEKNCKDVEPAANESETGEKENTEKNVETKPEVEETEISAKEVPEVESKEVHVKPASKHSNLISKVKQSFVKAKKAIIGKSQSSKTMSAEAKGEIKVK